MSFWVYILRCSDNSYYTGQTDNLERRVAEHLTGAIPTCYTYKRRPVKLVFSQDFATREEAITSERQIKGWSRKKKEAMMRGDWAEVSRLAKSHTVQAESVEAPTDQAELIATPAVRAEPVKAQPPFDKPRANGVCEAQDLPTRTVSPRPSKTQRLPPQTVRAELVEAQPPFDCSINSQLKANGK